MKKFIYSKNFNLGNTAFMQAGRLAESDLNKAIEFYNECINLNRRAPWNLEARKNLRDLKKKAKATLENKYKYRQKALESDLGEDQVKLVLRTNSNPQKEKTDEDLVGEKKEEKSKNGKTKEQMKEKNKKTNEGYAVKEIRRMHPYDKRFKEVEDNERFDDMYLWISPQVRESIEKNKEEPQNPSPSNQMSNPS